MTFLVISCPCALVLSVPLTYFSGIGAGSRRGILFKGGASLEALNNVKTIVMDKTGTITKGNFVVQNIVPAKGVPLNEGELLWLFGGGGGGASRSPKGPCCWPSGVDSMEPRPHTEFRQLRQKSESDYGNPSRTARGCGCAARKNC